MVSEIPKGLLAIVEEHVAHHGAVVALRRKTRGIWQALTWAQLGDQLGRIGVALGAAGFQSGAVGAVLGVTSERAALVDLAVIGSGGVAFAIAPNTAAAVVGDLLRKAAASIVFVEDEEQLDKVLEVRDSLSMLKRIVIFDMKGLREFSDPQCESFTAFLARVGDEAAARSWLTHAAERNADSPCVLILTSTERPRRLLTMREVAEAVGKAQNALEVRPGDERLAVASMADPLERIAGFYLGLTTMAVTNYPESSDTLVENLQELQPTVLGMPTAEWALLESRIEKAALQATRIQSLFYRWAFSVGQRRGLAGALANLIVIRRVRREIGLGRLRVAYAAAGAALPAGLRQFTSALGISIRQPAGTTGAPSALPSVRIGEAEAQQA